MGPGSTSFQIKQNHRNRFTHSKVWRQQTLKLQSNREPTSSLKSVENHPSLTFLYRQQRTEVSRAMRVSREMKRCQKLSSAFSRDDKWMKLCKAVQTLLVTSNSCSMVIFLVHIPVCWKRVYPSLYNYFFFLTLREPWTSPV